MSGHLVRSIIEEAERKTIEREGRPFFCREDAEIMFSEIEAAWAKKGEKP